MGPKSWLPDSEAVALDYEQYAEELLLLWRAFSMTNSGSVGESLWFSKGLATMSLVRFPSGFETG